MAGGFSKLRNLVVVSLPAVLVLAVSAELLLRFVPGLRSLGTDPVLKQAPYRYGEGIRLFQPNMDTKVDYLTGSADYTFRTNAFGLRSRPVSREKPPETLRILCVGDSFTEGFGVNQEETFPNRLDGILNGLGVQSEVLCAAMSGFHIWDYADLVHHYVDLLGPDAVILGIYSGNDIDPRMLEVEGRMAHVVSYGFLIPASRQENFRANLTFGAVYFSPGWGWFSDTDRWLCRRLRSYRLISDRIFQSGVTVRLLAGLGVLRLAPKIDPLRLPALNMDTDLYLAGKAAPGGVAMLYDSAEKAYRDMVAYTRENGVLLLALNIPEVWQNPVWAFQKPQFTRLHDQNRVHNFWINLNRKYGVHGRDLKPVYREAWSKGVYPVFDLSAPHGHFSPRDNTVVAFILLDMLMEQGLVRVDEGRLETYYRTHYAGLTLPFSWAQGE